MSTFQSTTSQHWVTPFKTLEEVTRLLKRDSGTPLREIKLCWWEPGASRNDCLGNRILQKRKLECLKKALKKSPHHIHCLSVGWNHDCNRKPLIKLLRLFVTNAERPSLKGLDSIELVLAAWIPDTTLLELLLCYAAQLKNLHIQATRMKVRTKKPNTSLFKNAYQSVHAVEYILEEESVVKLLSVPTLACRLTKLTTLSFVDCDIVDSDVDVLVAFLWRNYALSGLPTLGLRSNRHMNPKALQKIVQAPVSERLDLSLCDISNGGALAVAWAMQLGNRANWRQKNGIVLREFSLSGNCQLDEEGFLLLARCCPGQVQHWDLSYCDWNENQTCFFLRELTSALMDPFCPLKELILLGSKVNNAEACGVVKTILRVNRSLANIILDDPKHSNPMNISNLQTIVQGLKHNYVLQDLQLDLRSLTRQKQLYPETFETACSVRDEMDFYLTLNRCGRCLLQSDNRLEKKAWILALLKAGELARFDVLYWLLRNGVHQLF